MVIRPMRSSHITPLRRASDSRAGQVMVFLIMALVVITFAVLWNVDLHKIITVKNKTQNAGDAAALAAARWQGITLNLIGDLNILQAAALSDGDTASAAAVADLQARLCFAGPMIGFVAAQQAAKNNGMFVNADYTAAVLDHANLVRNTYPLAIGPNGNMLFPEPYPGAWTEYADMIEMVANDGIAVAPDNASYFYDPTRATAYHELYDTDFYHAIAGTDWCWFLAHYNLLTSYTDYSWWPNLPDIILIPVINSEYFSLGLNVQPVIDDLALVDAMNTLAAERTLTTTPITTNCIAVSNNWYCYDGYLWTAWDILSPTSNPPFPIYGPVKSRYNYAGADACTRIETAAERRTPGARPAPVMWTAAAKPFGYLEDDARPHDFNLVLPAFREARLFPVDAASGSGAGAFDLEWRRHIEKHLPGYNNPGVGQVPGYIDQGPGAPACEPNCFYCQQLTTWEDAAFRASGVYWLSQNSNTCNVTTGGGGGGSAGGRARRGH